jgi:hypothetical protein
MSARILSIRAIAALAEKHIGVYGPVPEPDLLACPEGSAPACAPPLPGGPCDLAIVMASCRIRDLRCVAGLLHGQVKTGAARLRQRGTTPASAGRDVHADRAGHDSHMLGGRSDGWGPWTSEGSNPGSVAVRLLGQRWVNSPTAGTAPNRVRDHVTPNRDSWLDQAESQQRGCHLRCHPPHGG